MCRIRMWQCAANGLPRWGVASPLFASERDVSWTLESSYNAHLGWGSGAGIAAR